MFCWRGGMQISVKTLTGKISAGKLLEIGRTLADYDILQGCTLRLVFRWCGGMQIFVKTLAAKIWAGQAVRGWRDTV